MEIIKKVFIALGGVFLALVAIGASVFGFVAYQGMGLDRSSRAYVDQNIPLITSTWSLEALRQHASPQLLEALQAKPEQTQQLFAMFSKLGALKHYDGSKGDARMFYDATRGKEITADYVANATFEHGEARLKIHLVQVSDQWQFAGFHVDSPQFMGAMNQH